MNRSRTACIGAVAAGMLIITVGPVSGPQAAATQPGNVTPTRVISTTNPYVWPHGSPFPEVQRSQPITHGRKWARTKPDGPRQKLIYLTYDDGPAGTWTTKIARQLHLAGLTATFFVNGVNATSTGRATMREVVNRGMTLAGHSWSHHNMGGWSMTAVGRDLDRMRSLISRTVGAVPTCWRAPYGSVGSAGILAARRRGLNTAGWAMDPNDWREPGAATVTSHIAARLRPGAIVLLHDGAGHGRQALEVTRRLIPILKQRGFTTGNLCPMVRTRPS